MTAASTAPIDVSILVNTFQKPRHLALVLESIALQRTDCRLEVVVSDDGSTDDTAAVVAAFAAHAPFPVRFTTQPHDGFRLARVRNAAARLARGGYLLFLDGDCVVPPHHVAAHLARRRHGTALLGYCARLSRAKSDLLVPENLPHADLPALVPLAEQRALAKRRLKAWWHAAVRHPTKPRLAGGDFGVWRHDFERVNGFDERFVGWGQEDDDLGLRLRAAGVRLESILGDTCSLHVWHPTDPTAAVRWRDGPNVAYFERRGRLTACRHGLIERPAASLRWGLPDDLLATPLGRAAARLLAGSPRAAAHEPCEIELVVRPGRAVFHREAECRLLIIQDAARAETAVRRAADRVACVSSGGAANLETNLAAAFADAG
jgi:GT2 family glycosyltransferase